MAEHQSNEALAVIGAIGTAIGVIGKSAVDRLRQKDQYDANTTRRLWKRIDELEAQLTKSNERLDHCQDQHRECESKFTILSDLVKRLQDRLEVLER